jgi:hypothetical protein
VSILNFIAKQANKADFLLSSGWQLINSADAGHQCFSHIYFLFQRDKFFSIFLNHEIQIVNQHPSQRANWLKTIGIF